MVVLSGTGVLYCVPGPAVLFFFFFKKPATHRVLPSPPTRPSPDPAPPPPAPPSFPARAGVARTRRRPATPAARRTIEGPSLLLEAARGCFVATGRVSVGPNHH